MGDEEKDGGGGGGSNYCLNLCSEKTDLCFCYNGELSGNDYAGYEIYKQYYQ